MRRGGSDRRETTGRRVQAQAQPQHAAVLQGGRGRVRVCVRSAQVCERVCPRGSMCARARVCMRVRVRPVCACPPPRPCLLSCESSV